MPLKSKEAQVQKKNTLTSLRQHLRNKLIQIGMRVEAEQPSINAKKKSNRQSRGVLQSENLPSLHSMRTNRQVIQQFRQAFVLNQKQLMSYRQAQKALSKEVIRGSRYDYSPSTCRDDSPCSTSPIQSNKASQSPKIKHFQGKLPSVERNSCFKSSTIWEESNRLIRFTQPIKVQQRQLLKKIVHKPRRSKTEQQEGSTCKEKYKKVRKFLQLGPWEGKDIHHDTFVNFH